MIKKKGAGFRFFGLLTQNVKIVLFLFRPLRPGHVALTSDLRIVCLKLPRLSQPAALSTTITLTSPSPLSASPSYSGLYVLKSCLLHITLIAYCIIILMLITLWSFVSHLGNLLQCEKGRIYIYFK